MAKAAFFGFSPSAKPTKLSPGLLKHDTVPESSKQPLSDGRNENHHHDVLGEHYR